MSQLLKVAIEESRGTFRREFPTVPCVKLPNDGGISTAGDINAIEVGRAKDLAAGSLEGTKTGSTTGE